MSLKENLLGQRWLTGLSNASYVVAGFYCGIGKPLLGLGLGVLGVGLQALQYNMLQQEQATIKKTAYGDGFAHAQRRLSSR